MWKSVPIVSVACAATLLRAEPEVKGTPVELTAYLTGIPRLVSVTGEAEVRIPAKRALLTLTVITEYRSLQEALRANADLRAKVTSHLKQQGIPADRVQSSKFSSTPKFGIFGEKAKSYRVENLMRVSVQDEKELRSAASAVMHLPKCNMPESSSNTRIENHSSSKPSRTLVTTRKSAKRFMQNISVSNSPRRDLAKVR